MTRIIRHLYRCNNCKKEGAWSKSWSAYGSLAMKDEYPQEMPTMCSPECEMQFRQGMAMGRIGVPNVKYRGYSVKIIGKRIGY